MSSPESCAPAERLDLHGALITAINIDLWTALALGRASARAIADLSPEAAHRVAELLEQEAASLDARAQLESLTAASIVRRTLDEAA